MSQSSIWKTLEANPEVVEEYVKNLGGPQNIQFSDLYSTESWALEMVPKPVVALLFVYPITPKSELHQAKLMKQQQNEKLPLLDLWFTKQTVRNACGTVALLHILGNLQNRFPLKANGILKTFYDTTQSFDAETRAKKLETATEIAQAHSIAQGQGQSKEKEDVNEHFVAFVLVNDYIIEFDGRKDQPIIHKKTTPENFLSETCATIKEHYIDIDPDQINFSIIAVSEKV